MHHFRIIGLLIAALCAAAGLARAENAVPRPTKSDVQAAVKSGDLQKLMEQFKSRRDAMLANREALLSQLKTATAEQRKAILEKMQALQQGEIENQREMGKQIRDEMRRLRQTTPVRR